MVTIETTPENFENISWSKEGFKYFTIGKGKAKYHFIDCPDGTVGWYYCYRMFEDGSVGNRRGVRPLTKLKCHFQ